MQREKAGVGRTSGPTRCLSHLHAERIALPEAELHREIHAVPGDAPLRLGHLLLPLRLLRRNGTPSYRPLLAPLHDGVPHRAGLLHHRAPARGALVRPALLRRGRGARGLHVERGDHRALLRDRAAPLDRLPLRHLRTKDRDRAARQRDSALQREPRSEKGAKLAQKLGQLQPFLAVFQ